MPPLTHTLLSAATLLFAGLTWPGDASGQGGERIAALGPAWIALASEQLDHMRGGFETPTGLRVSFGIERAVYINGELIATTRVEIPDVGRMTAEQALALSVTNDTTLIQNGAGNVFDSNALTGGLVIQNTLNDQDIRSLTELTAGVNTLGLFKDINAQAALHDALLTAPGGP